MRLNRAAVYALDAIEGDPEFIARTCDCRTKTLAKKANKKALKQMLASLQDQSEDQQPAQKSSIVVDGEEDDMVTEKERDTLETVENVVPRDFHARLKLRRKPIASFLGVVGNYKCLACGTLVLYLCTSSSLTTVR
jgi:hypothetical protein